MLDLGLTASATTTQPSSFAEVTTATFERDVLQASLGLPVIVQFWAPWCGPCKQLKPVLEKAVAEAGAAVTMVRVNIDTSPDLAQMLRVQSVPMVYAFFQGQPVDGFVGMRPDSEIKAFVARLVKLGGGAAADAGSDPELFKTTIAQADAFFADDKLTEALAAYSTAYDLDPQSARALAGIAWCFVAQQDAEAFDAVLGELTPEQQADKDLAGVMRLRGWRAEDTAGAAGVNDAASGDHGARYERARAQLAALDVAGALDSLLTIIRAQRDWNNGAARVLLLDILEALGNAHPLVKPARRQLSAVLFS